MAKYGIEMAEGFAVEVDLPPDAPALSQVQLSFDATEETLRSTLEQLGGVGKFHINPTSTVLMRFGLPLTRDGEIVGRAMVHVHLRGQELPEVEYPAIRALRAEQTSQARS